MEGSGDLRQVALGAHYRVDVLVGGGGFVAQAGGAAVVEPDVGHLAVEVARGDAAAGLVARERAAGAVGAGTKRRGVAAALDVETGGAHRAGDDARFAFGGGQGAFAVDPE